MRSTARCPSGIAFAAKLSTYAIPCVELAAWAVGPNTTTVSLIAIDGGRMGTGTAGATTLDRESRGRDGPVPPPSLADRPDRIASAARAVAGSVTCAAWGT